MNLTQERLASLAADEREEYEIWQELVGSRGYKLLAQFLKDQMEGVEVGIHQAASWDSYKYTQGYRDALNQTLHIAEIVEAKLEEMADQNAALNRAVYAAAQPVEVDLDAGAH